MRELPAPYKRALLALAALVVVLVVAIAAYGALSSNRGGSMLGGGSPNSWNAPELASVAVNDPDGYPITLGEVADGKVTVINLWTTWCVFCRNEMRDYQKLYNEYGDDVRFIMLNGADDEGEVQEGHAFVQERGFTFPVYYDEGGEVRAYFGVTSYPTTIVIDADGKVLNNRPGQIELEGMREALDELVNR